MNNRKVGFVMADFEVLKPNVLKHGFRSYDLVTGSKPCYCGLTESREYLALKDSTHSLPSREKLYLNSGRIYRGHFRKYFSFVPKNGTGQFYIRDGEHMLEGVLEKGKIVKIDSLSASLVPMRTIDSILKQIETGGLKVENITRVYLKKALEFLKTTGRI